MLRGAPGILASSAAVILPNTRNGAGRDGLDGFAIATRALHVLILLSSDFIRVNGGLICS